MKRKTLFFILACMAYNEAQALEIPYQECGHIAGAFQQNPFALSPGDLDALILCARQVQEGRSNEARRERENKAIDHNFGKPEKDGE